MRGYQQTWRLPRVPPASTMFWRISPSSDWPQDIGPLASANPAMPRGARDGGYRIDLLLRCPLRQVEHPQPPVLRRVVKDQLRFAYDNSLLYQLYGLTEEEDTAIERSLGLIHQTDEAEDGPFLKILEESQTEERVSREEVMGRAIAL